MPLKLEKADQSFRNSLINPIDAKRVDLDRTLVNLFMLIRFNGRRPVAVRSLRPEDLHLRSLLGRLTRDVTAVKGLDAFPSVVEKWLASDLIDMVHQGVPGKEAVASPRPLHLYAYRLRNPKHTRDYNTADLAYSLIDHADRALLDKLRDFFDGVEEGGLGGEGLDLDTLLVWRLVSDWDLRDAPSGERQTVPPPLDLDSARLFTDDLRRLLAYRDVVPRHVMLDYLKILLGLHLALYNLRLLHLLPGWVNSRRAGGECAHCRGSAADLGAPCRYQPLLLVDMGDDYRTPMAALSQANVEHHYSRINDYIKATFTLNHLLAYLNNDFRRQGQPASVTEALDLYRDPPPMFEPTFTIRVNQLFRFLDEQRVKSAEHVLSSRKRAAEQAQWAEIDAIRNMQLGAFATFIEVISYARTPFHRPYTVELLDSLLQKNSEGGLLWQGRAKANGRRFHIGSRLLEVLVQLAVLEPSDEGGQAFKPRPMLVDEFVHWLLERYGLVINGLDVPEHAQRAGMAPPPWATRVGVRELEAYRDNLRALKDRLREIGFYTDVSDAYNAQTIRPRYTLDSLEGGA